MHDAIGGRVVRAALAVAVAIPLLGVAALVGSTPADATALSISVVGNHLVNGDGTTVRLLGVDVPGTEYACQQGWGYSDLPISQASADAVAAWHADAVRVPLNEDCWLGINGQPSGSGQTAVAYRSAVEQWVSSLNADGIYAVLDLHWSAPGTNVADGQRPMPDDHSVAFWTSVAATFLSNHAVVFDAFNEPYSPLTDGNSTLGVSWTCWESGGCTLPVARDGDTPNDAVTYTAVGMQQLVTAIRGTGATQPVLLGGLSYSNDLSGWLAHEPTDPAGQLVASFHDYVGNACADSSCWNTVIAPLALQVPVVTGEFDEGYDCADPPAGAGTASDFDNTFMGWADAHGVSYLAWGWYVLGNATTLCSSIGGAGDNFALVSDVNGTPVAPDGTDLRSHLAALASETTPPTTTTLTGTPPTTIPGSPVGSGRAGYDLVGSDGGVFVFPTGHPSGFYGSLPGLGVRVRDVVGIVPSSDDHGYFLVGADGGVFSFGDTAFEGSLPGLGVTVDDIVGIVPTADDRGYFLVGRDGGVFAFGDARFLGSLPGTGDRVDDVVGIAGASGGTGYWVVEADGAVTAFGNAARAGNASVGSAPVAGIAATADGSGYWVVTTDGGVQSFGDAGFHGSLPVLGVHPALPVVSLVPTPDGAGYWLFGSDGGVFAFGDAGALGSLPGLSVHVGDVVGAVPTSS